MIGAEGEHRIEDRRRRRCGLRCKMRRETKRASTSDFVVEGPHPPPTGNHCVGRGQKEKKSRKKRKKKKRKLGWGVVGTSGRVGRKGNSSAIHHAPRRVAAAAPRNAAVAEWPRPAGRRHSRRREAEPSCRLLPPPLHPAVGHAESAWPSGSFASLLVCVCGVWCVWVCVCVCGPHRCAINVPDSVLVVFFRSRRPGRNDDNNDSKKRTTRATTGYRPLSVCNENQKKRPNKTHAATCESRGPCCCGRHPKNTVFDERERSVTRT